MIVYYFNPKIVKQLTKIRVISEPRTNYNGRRWEVQLHPDDDPRKYGHVNTLRGKNLMDVSRIEGEIYSTQFWLKEENDEKAEEIYRDYVANRIKKELEKVERIKRNYGV